MQETLMGAYVIISYPNLQYLNFVLWVLRPCDYARERFDGIFTRALVSLDHTQ